MRRVPGENQSGREALRRQQVESAQRVRRRGNEPWLNKRIRRSGSGCLAMYLGCLR